MTLLTAFLSLIGGFVLLVAGGEALVRSAISLAVRTKIPPAIISLTIIAAGTSAPELFTSLFAALKNSPDIAAGNVFGSNIFNVLAILGFSFLVYPPKKPGHRMVFEWIIVVIACVTIYFFAKDALLTSTEGFVLISILGTTLFISVKRARLKSMESTDDDDEPIEALKTFYWDFIYLTVGLAALIGGAQLALEGGVFIGKWAGLSEKVIGITIISVGTGLPEFATSAVAAFRGRSDIAIGNVLGSNIINTLAVFGVTAAAIPLYVSPDLIHVDFWIFVLTTTLLWPIVLGKKWALSRWAGGFYLVCYMIYIFGCLTGWTW